MITFWNNLFVRKASNWIHGWLDPSQTPGSEERQEILPGSAYLHLFIKSMHIVNVRIGLTKFYGAVHSFASIPHRNGQDAQFNTVVVPAQLRNVDAKHIERAIQMNRRLLGPIPYRGGDIRLEIGLFSIKSADLAQPFLALLENMSSLAGVSLIQTALPFADPIKHGIELLTGTDDDAILECGLAFTLPTRLESGHYVVLGASKNTNSIRLEDISINPKDYTLVDGKGVTITNYPYMVLDLSSTPTNPTWFSIPDISVADNDLRSAVRTGNPSLIKDAQAVFRRIVLTSPDLLEEHAKTIVREVNTWVSDLGGAELAMEGSVNLPPLDSIQL